MFNPALVTVISALTALFASIAGPLVALYVARIQFKAAVRATNRQRWIEEFREMIASFCAEAATINQVRTKVIREGRIAIPAEPEIMHHFQRLIFTTNKIRLMINPHEQEHQQLLESVNGLLALFRSAPMDRDIQDEAQEVVGQLINVSVKIIRREWLRVQRGV